MSSVFTILLMIAMLATLGALVIGIGVFAVGGEASRKHSNKLMRFRVLFQGIAILAFVLLMLASS